jgi:hypothetical protein
MSEKIKEYGSTIIWVLGIIFFAGAMYAQVRAIANNGTKREVAIAKNSEAINELKTARAVNQSDIKDIKGSLERIEDKLMIHQ